MSIPAFTLLPPVPRMDTRSGQPRPNVNDHSNTMSGQPIPLSRSDLFFSTSYALSAPVALPSTLPVASASTSPSVRTSTISPNVAPSLTTGTQATVSVKQPSTFTLAPPSLTASYARRASDSRIPSKSTKSNASGTIIQRPSLCTNFPTPSAASRMIAGSTTTCTGQSPSQSNASAPGEETLDGEHVSDIERRLQEAVRQLRLSAERSETSASPTLARGRLMHQIQHTSRSRIASHVEDTEDSSAVLSEAESDASVDGASEDEEDANISHLAQLDMSMSGRSRSFASSLSYAARKSPLEPFAPQCPLQPLSRPHMPRHRYSSSDTLCTALRRARTIRTAQKRKQRRVSFRDEHEIVDVFAAVDYPARRGPPPTERLSMRDILELRQVKIELGVFQQTSDVAKQRSSSAVEPRTSERQAAEMQSGFVAYQFPSKWRTPPSLASSIVTPAAASEADCDNDEHVREDDCKTPTPDDMQSSPERTLLRKNSSDSSLCSATSSYSGRTLTTTATSPAISLACSPSTSSEGSYYASRTSMEDSAINLAQYSLCPTASVRNTRGQGSWASVADESTPVQAYKPSRNDIFGTSQSAMPPLPCPPPRIDIHTSS